MLPWVFGWLALATIVTFASFGIDKVQARRGGRRIAERTLLAMVFVGGTIGALVAMPVFRHKTVKSSFRWKLAGVLVVQAVIIGVVVWRVIDA